MRNNVSDIDLEEVSFVGKGANQGAHVLLMKRADAHNGTGEGMTELEKLQKKFDDLQAEHGALVKSAETLTTDHAALVKSSEELATANAELKKEMNIKKADVIDKSALPENVRKALDEQEARIKKQDDDIAMMKSNDLKKSCDEKGAELSLIGKDDDVSAALLAIAKADEALVEPVMALLKTANARIKEGSLFKEFGVDGEGDTKSALDKINELAKAHAVSTGVTFEKAFAHVYSTNTDLVKEYRKEGGK